MFVNVCTVILIIICETLAYYDREYSPNVGTVLFSTHDNRKNQWSKTEISLLRARRYFQTILPPAGFLNTFTEDYINILLEYFRDAYANIKREAMDPETDTIMTTALSDTLGGYLKVWVLPVAKLDYYGGTVSQEHIVKLFQFYNEIKKFLDTNGEGWRSPDENLLNSITINVAPLRLSSRSMKDPCDRLAYFEKTPTGLGIPMPKVNWNDKTSTLFVPLKNVTLISVSDPDTASTLVKYYDTAKSCIALSNPSEADKFDENFQLWLSKDIVPHLKDENLYLALGSVLTLVNRTRNLCDNVIDLYANKCHIIPKSHIPFDFTSKKMIIICIILVIEVAWCVPALIYLLCTKKKKSCSSNVYLFVDGGKPDKKDKMHFFKKNRHTKNVQLDPRPTSFRNLKDTETQRPSIPPGNAGTVTSAGQLFTKPQVSYMEFEGQCPSSQFTVTAGTGSRSYFSSKNQSSEAVRTTEHTSKKSSLKKIFENATRVHHHTARVMAMSSQEELGRPPITMESFPILNESRKSLPKKRDSKDSKQASTPKKEHSKESRKGIIRKRNEHSRDSKTSKRTETSNDTICEQVEVKTIKHQPGIPKTSESEMTKSTETSGSQIAKTTESEMVDFDFEQIISNTDIPVCPCTGCVHCGNNMLQETLGSFTTIEKQEYEENYTQETENITTRFQVPQDYASTKTKKAGFRVSHSGRPFFEITIDRPATEISVDVSTPMQKTASPQARRSRIPKLNPSALQAIGPKRSRHHQGSLSPDALEKRRSLIPQPKKRTVDDIVLTHCCCKSNRDRLNDTM